MPFHGLRVGVPGSVVPASIDPAAIAWKAAVVSAGGTVSAAQLSRVSRLIAAYKAAGIWSKLDREWLLWSENIQQATIDIVSLSSLTFHGTAGFTANAGYTGDGSTSYADTGFIPSSAGGHLTQNSAYMDVYLTNARTAINGSVAIGSTNGSGNIYFYIQPLTGPNNFFWDVNGSSFPNNAVSSTSGQFAISRNGSGSVGSGYLNGALLTAGADTSIGLSTKSIFIGAFDDGGAADDFSTDTIAMASFGGGLSDAEVALKNAADKQYAVASGFNVIPSAALTAIFAGHAASTLPLFGVNTHKTIDDGPTPITPAQNLSMVQTLGVSLVRIDTTNWQDIETSAGVYNFAASDPYITGASGLRTAGMTVQLLLGYSNTLYESSIFTGPTDSTGKTAYDNYAGGAAGSVVAHYGATGFIYELWNEPNISTGAGGYAWSPSANATDYSALATGAAAAIVGRTAAAKIITAGVAPTGAGIDPVPFGTTMNGALTWTNFQGAALHPYNNGVLESSIPEQSITDSAAFAAAVSNAAAIYWSEVGYPTVATGNSETLKAIYDARLVLSAVIAQVKEIALYQLASDGGFGLFDGSFNILPAGTAYKNLISAFAGATSIDASQFASLKFWAIACHISGGVRRIVWSASSTYVFASTESSISAASAVDLFGNSIPVTINGNVVSVTIDPNVGPVVLSVTN